MAASSVSSPCSWITDQVKFINFLDSFSFNKDKLESAISPEYVNSVSSGLKQYFYWRKLLVYDANDCLVLFTSLSHLGLSKPKVFHFKPLIDQLIGPGQITSIYFPENSNFLGFHVSNLDAAKVVRQSLSSLTGDFLLFIDPPNKNVYDFKVLWAPSFTPLEDLISVFDKYCDKIEASFEQFSFEDGAKIPSNIAHGRLTLKKDVPLNSIPHISTLPNHPGKHVLIIIPNRPPLCLRCRDIGHTRKSCPKRFCHLCHSSHSASIPCPPNFFSTVGGCSSLNLMNNPLGSDPISVLDYLPSDSLSTIKETPSNSSQDLNLRSPVSSLFDLLPTVSQGQSSIVTSLEETAPMSTGSHVTFCDAAIPIMEDFKPSLKKRKRSGKSSPSTFTYHSVEAPPSVLPISQNDSSPPLDTVIISSNLNQPNPSVCMENPFNVLKDEMDIQSTDEVLLNTSECGTAYVSSTTAADATSILPSVSLSNHSGCSSEQSSLHSSHIIRILGIPSSFSDDKVLKAIGNPERSKVEKLWDSKLKVDPPAIGVSFYSKRDADNALTFNNTSYEGHQVLIFSNYEALRSHINSIT